MVLTKMDSKQAYPHPVNSLVEGRDGAAQDQRCFFLKDIAQGREREYTAARFRYRQQDAQQRCAANKKDNAQHFFC